MNYQVFFATAQHQQISFKDAFNLLCALHSIVSPVEEELLYAEIAGHKY